MRMHRAMAPWARATRTECPVGVPTDASLRPIRTLPRPGPTIARAVPGTRRSGSDSGASTRIIFGDSARDGRSMAAPATQNLSHARPCAGHPRLDDANRFKNVDGQDKPGHDAMRTYHSAAVRPVPAVP